jgi:IS30 family transposase
LPVGNVIAYERGVSFPDLASLPGVSLTLPAQLRRSITWHQGKEMAQHIQFTVDTGVQVYFCDPKEPVAAGKQREHHGLLRQYLPKSTDLSQPTLRELDAIARSLNTRPRQTLGWMTPSKAFADAVALTG